MACYSRQCFLCPRLWLVLALAVWPIVTEGAVLILLRGEVGGNVTFKSSTLKQGKIQYMYLQKDINGHQVFINGYYSGKHIKESPWPNTRVDNNTNEVHMFGLNMSHSGDYDLLIHYNNDGEPTKTIIRLNITGKYSAPSVTLVCSDENKFKSCIVTCASHGGFPLSNMAWKVFGTENTRNNDWKVLNKTEDLSKDTKLFTSSSTAFFNCSRGEMNFSCSVGGVTSEEHTVCTHQDPPNNPNLYVIILACLVPFVVVVISLGLWWWRCKKRPIGTAAAKDVVEELQLKGREEEITVLTESKEVTEAS
ncbi:uncharacterized protein LOC110967663 [Acanthochromis polyacanthus]|uniref:uncharacterized protein LOC110967663 n=1 Tax=Acanthochromis polyacanthus TaxID=80966 RepID=UPI0022346515|nr:uncharacterized protein LOC110967663 [Acanthochromis polyacanthus]